MNKKFCRLLNSINSTIYEGIVKIGYEKNTSISIYYDLGLLNYLLDSSYQTTSECLTALGELLTELNDPEELLMVRLAKQRFQFTVTSKGVEKIMCQYENKPFLKDIIELARTHKFTLLDVKQVFERYDSEYHIEEVNNEEFQYVFSFKDKSIDEYMYCFNLNDCYYHRLLPYDYERL